MLFLGSMLIIVTIYFAWEPASQATPYLPQRHFARNLFLLAHLTVLMLSQDTCLGKGSGRTFTL